MAILFFQNQTNVLQNVMVCQNTIFSCVQVVVMDLQKEQNNLLNGKPSRSVLKQIIPAF